MAPKRHIWSEEALLAKSRLYIQRAGEVDAESSLYPLWSLLAFEFLARAVLARVHPVLLADPRDGTHTLYAFGFGDPKPPMSIPVRSVLRRCQAIVPTFTEAEFREGDGLMSLRNEELHTGSPRLEELSTSAWQPQYYRICEVLLDFLDLGLEDLFPARRAAAARQIIDGLAEDVESTVKQRIADRRREFKALDKEQQEERRERAPRSARPDALTGALRRLAKCPACGTLGVESGEVSGTGEPRVGAEEIEHELNVLPTAFSCVACGLQLQGHAEMHHGGLGDEFTVIESEDPLDYYGIDPKDLVSAEDFYEYDYGNE